MKALKIFIAHASDILTNHLPHGDGLIAFEFVSRLAERGHQVHVAVERVELKGELPTNLHVHRIPVPTGLPEGLRRLAFMVRMRLLFGRLNSAAPFDLVQQMNPVHAGLSLALLGISQPVLLGAYPARWPADADTVDAPHTGTHPGFRSKAADLARLMICGAQQSLASAAIVTTPAAMDRIVSSRLRRDRVFVLPLGVDAHKLPVRTEIPEQPSILFLANINVRKGIFTLLDAFEMLAKIDPKVQLTIGGEGPASAQVKEYCGRLSSCDRISMLGAVDRNNVAGLMRAHSVFCLASYGEPFSLTILEAMACGVPVVATDAGGPRYLVSEQGGRLAPPRDAATLAAALKEVLGSRELQECMGRFNRDRVEREFDWEPVLDGLERIYSKVLLSASAARKRATRALPLPVTRLRSKPAVEPSNEPG